MNQQIRREAIWAVVMAALFTGTFGAGHWAATRNWPSSTERERTALDHGWTNGWQASENAWVRSNAVFARTIVVESGGCLSNLTIYHVTIGAPCIEVRAGVSNLTVIGSKFGNAVETRITDIRSWGADH